MNIITPVALAEIYDLDPTPALNRHSTWAGTSALREAFRQVGALPLSNNFPDAALTVTLPPGADTIQINGVNGATGKALVEIYELF